ncbi:MAG: 3-deoxy-7-phosphoheptulonate synthase [Bacteroidota bacterium]
MIIQLSDAVSTEEAQALARRFSAILLNDSGERLLITSSKQSDLSPELEACAEEIFSMQSDIQLASRQFRPETREISLGAAGTIGGSSKRTLMMTGPCSVESEEQLIACAEFVKRMGIRVLRGGCFKPRTSPYSFQGLGEEGLKLLAQMRETYGLTIVTEVRDATHIDAVIAHSDIIQVGAKAMYDHGILRRCGQAAKPVLLKRGFGTTLQEFVQAAEFILSGGNPDVMLCERGIRTFETKTRFTLDLCGVAWLQEHTNLPIILDTSHAMGYRYGVPALTRACTAMGVDGLLIETHPNPDKAMSDAAQQLSFEQFEDMFASLKPIAAAVGRTLV